MKKWFAVFIIFFLGTSALVTVDHACKESTGAGGQAGVSVCKTMDGSLAVSFFGLDWTVER